MKNSPSFFSKSDLGPFFEDVDDEDVDADADVDAVCVMVVELEPDVISDSSHMWARTWQMPSSTSGLRDLKPG